MLAEISGEFGFATTADMDSSAAGRWTWWTSAAAGNGLRVVEHQVTAQDLRGSRDAGDRGRLLRGGASAGRVGGAGTATDVKHLEAALNDDGQVSAQCRGGLLAGHVGMLMSERGRGKEQTTLYGGQRAAMPCESAVIRRAGEGVFELNHVLNEFRAMQRACGGRVEGERSHPRQVIDQHVSQSGHNVDLELRLRLLAGRKGLALRYGQRRGLGHPAGKRLDDRVEQSLWGSITSARSSEPGSA
jgi:hypothetical protein